MNEQEKHDLMIRLDERTRNIWRVVENLAGHQEEQNGYIKDALIHTKLNRILISAIAVVLLTAIGWVMNIVGVW